MINQYLKQQVLKKLIQQFDSLELIPKDSFEIK